MAGNGYLPTRDQMIVVVRTSRDLYRIVRRWQSDSQLPGYPIEMGKHAAIEALFHLERALNPTCFAWENPSRKRMETRIWPVEVRSGLLWLRNLLDLILERNRLEALSGEANWANRDEHALPVVVSIGEQELVAFGKAIRLLPSPKSLLVTIPSNTVQHDRGKNEADANVETVEDRSVPAVQLGPGDKPYVLGKAKQELTPERLKVVKALLKAGEKGLKWSELQAISGDAVQVLKRLAGSDADWKAVIKLPGHSRKGYRIGRPDDVSCVDEILKDLAAMKGIPQ